MKFIEDIKKIYYSKSKSKKTLFEILFQIAFNYSIYCIAIYRFGQLATFLWSKSKLLGFVPKVMHFIFNQIMLLIFHVEIDPGAKIGRGFFLMHYSNINIGPVVIGENCTIHHNVTIGQGVYGGNQGVPSIGNNVWIGTGAIITGPIVIGNDVTISAGCVLSKDIPDRCLVGGNPGRIILANYDNSSFLTFRFK